MRIDRFLTQEDAAVISRLAETLLRTNDGRVHYAEQLIDLISTSILLPETDTRSDFVSLYSNVSYRIVGSNERQNICIVCPDEANEHIACASILAPLSMAIFGRTIGAIVEVELPFKRTQSVEIMDVQPTIMEDAGPSLCSPAAPSDASTIER
ncbi:MAG TPA: GreA/GreB family elongation factor [Noviherbaspirillum sp.]|nr:GreA/GreB family elongation factor [Noviherbaspirillum sp.]